MDNEKNKISKNKSSNHANVYNEKTFNTKGVSNLLEWCITRA